MTKIEFSKEEAAALMQLIDIAVKSAGLQADEAATVLARKIAPATADQTDISPKE